MEDKWWFVFLVILVMSGSCAEGQLINGFYSFTCPSAEGIVRSTVEAHFKKDPTILAGLLRLHFHDCFVQGCDASVLVNGSYSERSSPSNMGLKGFDVIDDAKSQLEALCPGIVSCADILALAARDAVALSSGPSWPVPTGRRDGRVSLGSQPSSNLPSPLESVADMRKKFVAKGLDDHDLVTLVGAHTIGQTHCMFFRYRIYNYTGFGDSDPTINPEFVSQLKTLCPQDSDGSERVALDQNSQTMFDVNYFKNLRNGNGILESDQKLWGDAALRSIVQSYAGIINGLFGLRFDMEFQRAMIKMSSIQVKTGTEGEIRNVCSKFN